ncbi:hypothetical protein [Acidianus brierleyi]|uniref:Uncharacterized protein n=1 Tax=Acidianus brierleyi TaxID=41673 RepID=A0A2U9IBX0_9CREN|nr:hypothetical protein [Acidianus brierleyi]AWR93490.1 hypothetical protein DFR85_01545 [Acidianus brierleyi]
MLTLLLLLLTLAQPSHSLLYQVTINVNNTLYTYDYNFSILYQNTTNIVFNLTITGNNFYQLKTYTVNTTNPYPLPINYNAFNTSKISFIKNTIINGKSAEIYSGYFDALGKYTIPVTIYFINGTLYSLNGTKNNINVVITQEQQPITTIPPISQDLETYFPLILFGIILVVGVIILIKVGKI